MWRILLGWAGIGPIDAEELVPGRRDVAVLTWQSSVIGRGFHDCWVLRFAGGHALLNRQFQGRYDVDSQESPDKLPRHFP